MQLNIKGTNNHADISYRFSLNKLMVNKKVSDKIKIEKS